MNEIVFCAILIGMLVGFSLIITVLIDNLRRKDTELEYKINSFYFAIDGLRREFLELKKEIDGGEK